MCVWCVELSLPNRYQGRGKGQKEIAELQAEVEKLLEESEEMAKERSEALEEMKDLCSQWGQGLRPSAPRENI